jgi:hypothetical protein
MFKVLIQAPNSVHPITAGPEERGASSHQRSAPFKPGFPSTPFPPDEVIQPSLAGIIINGMYIT